MRKFAGKMVLCAALVLSLSQTVYADEPVISDGPVEEQYTAAAADGSQVPVYIATGTTSAPDAGIIWDVVDAAGIVLEVEQAAESGVISGAPTSGSTETGVVSNYGPGSSSGTSSSTKKNNAVVTSAQRMELIEYAKQFLGNPYVYGGTSLTNGADCSGFTQAIFSKFGITTGRSSRDQYAKAQKITKADLKPGDLIFYASGSYINHVAIYCGNGIIIHAANESTGIATGNAYYREPYGYGRFIND